MMIAQGWTGDGTAEASPSPHPELSFLGPAACRDSPPGLQQSSPGAEPQPGKPKPGETDCEAGKAGEPGEMNSISVGSCSLPGDFTLHTRSLRNTAGRRAAQCEERRRVEAGKKMLEDLTSSSRPEEARPSVSRRCERGRVPSDSSSGISDDASSSSSGSDRDSGIETGDTLGTAGLAAWGHSNNVPVTFGIDQDDRSQVDTLDREKIREALENGVRRMNLVEKQKTDKNSQGKERLRRLLTN